MWSDSAPKLAAAGYRPVPITPGYKYPRGMDGWRQYVYSPGDEWKWRTWGVGLLTGELVGVDIDILDGPEVKQLLQAAYNTLGPSPVRIGYFPKSLLIYRNATPQRKRTLNCGESGKIEILGEGQQFVAFATHPDTGQPYVWHGGSPLDIPFAELKEVDAQQIEQFLVRAAEIAAVGSSPSPPPTAAAPSSTQPSAPPNDLSAGMHWPFQECARGLLKIRLSEHEYERWRNIGWGFRAAAIADNHDGEIAYKVWLRWCQSQPGYDGERPCRTVWDTYDPGRDDGVTAATFYREALNAAELQSASPAETPFRTAAANIAGQTLEEDDEDSAAILKRKEAQSQAQGILENEVLYLKSVGKYFHMNDRRIVPTEFALKQEFASRMPLVKHGGKRIPLDPVKLLEQSESKIQCDDLGFNPTAGPVYEDVMGTRKLRLANQFHPFSPEPIKPTAEDVATFRWFLDERLFPWNDHKSMKVYYLRWLAWPIYYPHIKMRSAPLFFSRRQGNGKTIALLRLPEMLLGWFNCRMVERAEAESDFSGYLQRAWLIHFNELRAGGERATANRLAEDLKTLITEDRFVSVAKGLDGLYIRNYLVISATSNYDDAMLLSDEDRRWGVHEIVTPRLDKNETAHIVSFMQDPQGPGKLRWILQNLVDGGLFEGFDPSAAPPMTKAKLEMIESSRPQWEQTILEILREYVMPFDRDCVATEQVHAYLAADMKNAPTRSTIGKALNRYPFNFYQRRTAKKRVWIVRNEGAWRQASEEECLANSEKGTVPKHVQEKIDAQRVR